MRGGLITMRFLSALTESLSIHCLRRMRHFAKRVHFLPSREGSEVGSGGRKRHSVSQNGDTGRGAEIPHLLVCSSYVPLVFSSPEPPPAPFLLNHPYHYVNVLLKNFPLSQIPLQSSSYYSTSIQDQAHQLSLVLLHMFILHFI